MVFFKRGIVEWGAYVAINAHYLRERNRELLAGSSRVSTVRCDGGF